MKSLYDAINQFWVETESSPLPPSACALYHLLCFKANRQRWQMPVKCSTEMIVYCLQITRPTLCAARKLLAEKRLICYVKGKRRNSPAEYTILDRQDDLTPNLTQDLTQGLTQNLTPNLTPALTPDLTQDFTIKYKKKEEKENNISITNAREEKISLKELEEKLSADEPWMQSVVAFIASCGLGTLEVQQVKDHLRRFFQYLSASGQDEREEADTRRYFNNWLKVQLKKNNNYGNTTNNPKTCATDRRRPLDISASSEKNYHAPF